MNKYSKSDWSKKPHQGDGYMKDCHCQDQGRKNCKCLDYSHDRCKCNGNSHQGGCRCGGNHGQYDQGCHCGGKGNYDDHRPCNCQSYQQGGCRRYICDDDFRLRLGGLQNGLNFRLRQLIGCYAEFTLEDSTTVYGKICHIGSNFVEMVVHQPVPYTEATPKDAAKDKHEDPKPAEVPEPTEKIPYAPKENHTMIFSLEKINHLKHHCGCPGPCGCK